MRAFVAIEMPDDVRRQLGRLVADLARSAPQVKWVDEKNMHLTLKFLGEIDDDRRSRLVEGIRLALAAFEPASLEVRGVGSFGNVSIIWAGCSGEIHKVRTMAREIERCAAEIGVPPEEREFAAHVTIGRVKDKRNSDKLKQLLKRRSDDAFGKFVADAITLFKSDLTPQGPIYSVVEKFAFQNARN